MQGHVRLGYCEQLPCWSDPGSPASPPPLSAARASELAAEFYASHPSSRRVFSLRLLFTLGDCIFFKGIRIFIEGTTMPQIQRDCS